MTTSTRLVAALKRVLKSRSLTYRELAERLGLSESAVKHMFSTGNFSLKRLDHVCEVLAIDIRPPSRVGRCHNDPRKA